MDWAKTVEFIYHLDRHLNSLTQDLGPWTYAVLFGSIFAETGLVIMPFFPGETLVFSAAALAATPESSLALWVITLTGVVAAMCGDLANYGIARLFGKRLFTRNRGRLFTRKQRDQANSFFQQYGPKSLFFSRYIPFIRNAMPFMAGVGEMRFDKVISFVFLGSFTWALFFSISGYFLAQIPFIRDNFHHALFVIMGIAALPVAIEYTLLRFKERRSPVRLADRRVAAAQAPISFPDRRVMPFCRFEPSQNTRARIPLPTEATTSRNGSK